MMRYARWLAVAALVSAPCGCGDDGGGGGGGGPNGGGDADSGGGGGDAVVPVEAPELPASALAEQSSLTVAAVEAAGKDGCLQAAVAALEAKGFNTFAAAGRTRGEDGTEALWRAHSGSGGAEAAAVQVCASGACECATVQGSGATLQVEPVDGGSGDLPVIGAPVLAKTLKGTALDAATDVDTKGGALLEPPLPKLEVAAYKGKKRFVVASAFGPAFGVSFEGLLGMAKQSGRYTDAREHAYAQAADLDALLGQLHNQDVLVWFGATVRVPKGEGKFKPEGMTVNRGLYGDQTYDRERIGLHLRRAPLGGPGLLVLAGAESFGTASEGLDPYGSVAHLVKSAGARPRAIVGFRGHASAQEALDALWAFFAELLGGSSLGAGLDAANAKLKSGGASATLVSNLDATEAASYSLQPALGAYWPKGNPSGQFVGNLLIGGASQCTPAGGGAPYKPGIEKSVQFFADITFDGPFFSGSRKDDTGEFAVFGLLGQLRQGGDVRFWVEGSKGEVSDITFFGDGRFCSEGQCAGSVTAPEDFGASGAKLFFAGGAEASTYTNAAGDECKPAGTVLTQTGSTPSWMTVGP